MENSVFLTISKSKKSIAVIFLSFILAIISGFLAIRIAQWNKSQAGIILSWARERQAKNIWQHIAQYGPPPGRLIANKQSMASFSQNLDEFMAIGLYGNGILTAQYKINGINFDFANLKIPESTTNRVIPFSSKNNIAIVKLIVGSEQNRRRRGRWNSLAHNCNMPFPIAKPMSRFAIIVFKDANPHLIEPFLHQMYLWPSVWLLATFLWFSLLFYQVKLANMQDKRQQEAHLMATGRMSARLAHEIKNPLGAIRGMSQHLQSEGVNSETSKVMLSSIEKETIRLEELTKNILDFSKPYKPKNVQANLVPLVQDVVAMFKTSTKECNIKLELPKNEINVNCDIDAIRQILLNLLSNAAEASKHPDIIVTLNETPKSIILSVIDNGTGISEGLQEDIFAPFFSTKNNGYGLGLAICKKLATVNSGSLEIYNNKTIGATAKLTITKEALL